MTEPSLEADFLTLVRSLDVVDRERVERLLAGVLSGRITLTSEDVEGLRPGDVMALADVLPAERTKDWPGSHGHS